MSLSVRPAPAAAAFLVAACLLPAAAAAQDAERVLRPRDVFALSLEELLDLKVVTASREEETVTRAASVMSVITAREIERAGYRTIYDVLARVPGFFPTSQATWKVLGSRGLVADGNDHILLLIDGHPQNSIVAHGFQQQDQIPALEKVERIEIIRGPGSVLWGTSAAHAIINVVTKDRIADGRSVQVSAGYAGGDGLWTANLLKGIRMGDATGVLSATFWQADGYNAGPGPNVEFPWGAATNMWPRLDAQSPGFEISLKLRDGEHHQILARVAQTSLPYPWDSWSYDPAGGVRPGAELRMRKAYLVYQATPHDGERLRVEYSGYGDMLLQNRFPLNIDDAPVLLDARWVEDQSREEVALGGEVSATYHFRPTHSLRIGSRYVHTVVGPNRGFRFDAAENLPQTPLPGEAQVPVVDIPAGRDNSAGIYAEDRWTVNGGRTDLFAGGRADYNDWRESRVVFLPRAGVIHSLSSRLTAKYVFNTGYLRPNAAYSKSGGKFYRSPSRTIEDVNVVDRSEEVRSNDLQLSYRDGRTYVAGTVFQMDVENFISWETRLDLGYRNMGAATTRGVEVEARQVLSPAVTLHGNYSFASARLDAIPFGVDIAGVTQRLDGALTDDRGRWLNSPRHTWNLGTDVILVQGHSLNANLRGWQQMRIVAPFTAANAGAYDTLGGSVYLDTSFLARDLLPGFDARVTGSNLLDNTDAVGMAINNGVYHPRGRSLGIQITTRF